MPSRVVATIVEAIITIVLTIKITAATTIIEATAATTDEVMIIEEVTMVVMRGLGKATSQKSKRS